jgi:hypothetical protein
MLRYFAPIPEDWRWQNENAVMLEAQSADR